MFSEKYPRSSALGLKPVNGAEGFDLPEVAEALGPELYAQFAHFLADKHVFVCGHRTAPFTIGDGDARRTVYVEVHCCYAADLEAFLAEGGR